MRTRIETLTEVYYWIIKKPVYPPALGPEPLMVLAIVPPTQLCPLERLELCRGVGPVA